MCVICYLCTTTTAATTAPHTQMQRQEQQQQQRKLQKGANIARGNFLNFFLKCFPPSRLAHKLKIIIELVKFFIKFWHPSFPQFSRVMRGEQIYFDEIKRSHEKVLNSKSFGKLQPKLSCRTKPTKGHKATKH